MSRIGKKPIEIPKGVKLSAQGSTVNVEGPKGRISFAFSSRVRTLIKEGSVTVEPVSSAKTDGALWGTTRSVIANMVKGVTEGFSKELVIEGVGFKAALQGKQINLSLGFTHPVLLDVPEGITVEVPKPTQVLVKGIDKVMVGLFASKIRQVYVAEPYKGKGVRYADEVVRRKAGKTVTK